MAWGFNRIFELVLYFAAPRRLLVFLITIWGVFRNFGALILLGLVLACHIA